MKRIFYTISIISALWCGFFGGVFLSQHNFNAAMQERDKTDIERRQYYAQQEYRLKYYGNALYHAIKNAQRDTDNVKYHMSNDELGSLYYSIERFRDDIYGLEVDLRWVLTEGVE